MLPESLINYFSPLLLHNKACPKYDQVRTVIAGMIVASTLLIILPIPLFFFFTYSLLYYILAAFCLATLWVIKKTGIFLPPTLLTFAASYVVLTYIILISGGIYSVHIATLYLLMLTGFWADRRIGHCMILINTLILSLIYYLTAHHSAYDLKLYSIGSKEYSLLFHACMTLFFGAFFSFVQQSHDEAKAKVRKKQLLEISSLSELVKKRNVELETMRQNLANDFHDDTGNLLASISQQASILKIKLGYDHSLFPILENITDNCEQLFESSRDFLWSVNHDSDNPMVLFYHLVDFGQNFYNQFDIAFSATPLNKSYFHILKTAPFASRNLIFIFKEAMTNAAKHAGATQISLKMILFNDYVKISLKDNGLWKEPEDAGEHKSHLHNGLKNIKRRSKNNDFKFNLYHNESGTCVEVYVPVTFSD